MFHVHTLDDKVRLLGNVGGSAEYPVQGAADQNAVHADIGLITMGAAAICPGILHNAVQGVYLYLRTLSIIAAQL